MYLNRYISKKYIVNLTLFLVLLGGAWLFDRLHAGGQPVVIESPDGSNDGSGQTFVYFCNPVNTVSLKTPVQKHLLKNSIRFNLSKQILLHHSARAFHTLKAEIPEIPDNYLVRNLLAFRNHHFSDSGEGPHLG